MGRESKEEWVYVLLIQFAVQQKAIQHCKLTMSKYYIPIQINF